MVSWEVLVGPDSVGVANFSCPLWVRIYKVRAETQLRAFLTLSEKWKKIKKENDVRTRKFCYAVTLTWCFKGVRTSCCLVTSPLKTVRSNLICQRRRNFKQCVRVKLLLLPLYERQIKKKCWKTEKWFYYSPSLKEQYHQNFAVLGQFCAKITTLRHKS